MGTYWGGATPPSTRRQRAAILAGATALAAVAWFGQPDVGETATTPDIMSPAGAEPPCAEDDPCWDCETMGNLVCGPRASLPVTG